MEEWAEFWREMTDVEVFHVIHVIKIVLIMWFKSTLLKVLQCRTCGFISADDLLHKDLFAFPLNFPIFLFFVIRLFSRDFYAIQLF